MEELTIFTNTQISNWYENALIDYGVVGSGSVSFTEDSVIVDYIENGTKKNWSMAFYPDYLKEQKIDWVYNCWSSMAQ